MATYTADAGADSAPVRLNTTGPTYMIGTYIAAGVTISSGDVYRMVKVPNGATIVDLGFFGRSSGVGGVVFSVGTSATASLFGAATISATHQFVSLRSQASATVQLPYRVSLSDDATEQFQRMLFTVASGTATATGTFGMFVEYLPRGQAGP